MPTGHYPRAAARERFEAKVDRSGGPDACHPWRASFGTTGYGQFMLDGKPHKAHRVAFFLEHGRWPEPLCRHTCDNRPCCNPRHLCEGTHAENSQDKVERGRSRKGVPNLLVRGLRNALGVLSDDDVLHIRTLYGQCTGSALAEAFGVSKGHIKNIAHGRDRSCAL